MVYNVLVVDDEPILRLDIADMLITAGYKVVGQAKDGIEAVKMSQELTPDLIIMDIKMPLLDGLSAAKSIKQHGSKSAILLLTAYSDIEFVNSAAESDIDGYLVKPIEEKSLIPALELAVSNCRSKNSLKQDFASVKKKFEDRKYIDRAKGILMANKELSEDEAFKQLRSIAMEKRITIVELSKILLGE